MRIISTAGEWDFSEEIPARYLSQKMPGSRSQYAATSFGEVLVQRYEQPFYTILLSRLHSHEDQGISIERRGPWTGITVVLRKHIRLVSPLGLFRLRQGQFIMMHAPLNRIESRFRASKEEDYVLFELRMSETLLEEQAAKYPLLKHFLAQVTAGQQALLVETTVNSGAKLLRVIENLSALPSDKTIVQRFIIEVLEAAAKHQGEDLPEHKIELMYAAREEILKDIRQHLSNAELARRAGTNERDLKVNFVKVFAMPPCQYLRFERIEAIKRWLIEEPKASIDELARRAGFAGAAAMDPVFRELEGCTPLRWRKQHRRR